ncbi:hypothetical protein V6N13_114533 [Hibiscus sabdariffa]|uniref:Uncharacterized protein n=1 Tax=Hibiscus sabdariffa TaxID=183260 RepID=A0ABR2U2C7_9ROSI
MASPNTKTHSGTWLCSPTKHPASFKCSSRPHRYLNHPPVPMPMPMPRGGVSASALMAKANCSKAFLLQALKPSRPSMQRRRNFQPKPSRFYLLNANRNGSG